MDFLEITKLFEEKIKADCEFELLEWHYTPYAFGSGIKSYKINGRNIKIVFDGRDGLIQAEISSRHEKYSSSNWVNIFHGTKSDFVDKGIEIIKKRIEV